MGLKLLNELRAGGVAADIDYAGRSMKAQMKEANRTGAKYAVILGEDEVNQGVVTLKDLKTGEQESVQRQEVCATVLTSPSGDRGVNYEPGGS